MSGRDTVRSYRLIVVKIVCRGTWSEVTDVYFHLVRSAQASRRELLKHSGMKLGKNSNGSRKHRKRRIELCIC